MHLVTITFGIENHLRHEDWPKNYSALLAPNNFKRVVNRSGLRQKPG